LKPGGWYESQEHGVEILADDGTVPEDSILLEWVRNLYKATDQLGKTCLVGPPMADWLKDAGYINVKQDVYKLPIGTWPKNKDDKEIGAFNLINMLDATEGYTMALYTRVLGKSVEQTQRDIVQIKKDLKKREYHMYFRFFVTYGQKPDPTN